ncbi:alpha/beta hydrolase [Pseudolysinimonas kribbensis]|uniref:Alpha/beta hydrolase n=1 Tax=Pseudolysinimonas kribbensis TaxID=433641 RepID=A0ABQ6K7S2_9MICO|nr:alpha/beta fold hydrolase [Pseudolysinimonas kribbensis]GMA96705.1 alpha/beta hydrolase [Pseudolysinimonas kribbensis]
MDDAARLDAALPDIDWSVLPPGAIASRFVAPSGEIAMISLGDPSHPRILMAPGVTGSKEDFILIMPALAEAGFHVQAVDIAGQYESGSAGPPPGARYTYTLFVDDMVALLEAGPTPAHLLGYSFAGTVAQLVAVRRPDLVRSLTLLATPPDPGNGFARMKRVGWLARVAGARVGAFFMVNGVKLNATKVDPGRHAFVRSRFALTSRRSVDDIIDLMMHAPDVEAELRELPIPKLVVVGIHDLWPVERSQALAERIGARFAGYDTGHSPSETAPHQLTRDLLELYAMA